MDFKDLGQNIIENFLSLTDRLLARIPEDKRRVVLIGAGGVLFLLIIITIVAIAGSGGKSANSQPLITSSAIPAEELFYPAEPDFLPPLLFEREPGQPWTQDDVRQFWTDPAAGHEDEWLETAQAVIDKLMEGVP